MNSSAFCPSPNAVDEFAKSTEGGILTTGKVADVLTLPANVERLSDFNVLLRQYPVPDPFEARLFQLFTKKLITHRYGNLGMPKLIRHSPDLPLAVIVAMLVDNFSQQA